MTRRNRYLWLTALGMMVLILDSKTALTGASTGIDLCIRTVIPSLFPFLFLSKILVSSLMGRELAFLRPIGRFCRMPEGSECLLLLGFIGGYPTGASSIGNCFQDGQLKKDQAERLLGFCNNAGPAFIFGIAGSLFTQPYIPWLLWGIHIVSALLTARGIPNVKSRNSGITTSNCASAPQALQHSVRVMAVICGWVVLFRILIAFCRRWFLWLLPPVWQCLFAGILELANGCCSLSVVTSPSVRFMLASAFLALGGICVAMQTCSVTTGLSKRWFYYGKLMHGLLSILCSCAIMPIIYPSNTYNKFLIGFVLVLIIALPLIFRQISKIKVAFPYQPMYNREKTLKR